ncbi:MAG: polysaccharide deacetylase family protein, partial [Lachnospiraceae bacterium]
MKRIPVQVKVAFVLTLMVLLSINCYFLPTARIVNGDVEFYDLIKCSQCGKRNLPIYRVKTDAPKIALTFDAAWGNEDTTQILDILDANDVKATFFMTG